MLASSSSVLRLEEVRDSAHAELPLLDMWHVARMLEKYPSNTRNALHIGLHHLGRGLVVAAGDQQRRHGDVGQPVLEVQSFIVQMTWNSVGPFMLR